MTYIHDQILPVGTQIGVYEIKGISKISAYDITYRAWNHHLKEQVKIQEYFPHDFAMRSSNGLGVEPKSPNDKENYDYGLKAFLDQAEVLTQIEHPNIAAAENILPFNGTAYLIRGSREGMPLSKLVQSQTSFAETELKFILVSILNALQKLHEHKIVHGGIQPATILIGKDGIPLLINFAAARLAIAARTHQFTDELAIGCAPAEQYEPSNESGPATDFYALGATIYACMTHHLPVAAQSRVLALSQGESDPMASLSSLADASFSMELKQAIDWMLRPEYVDRPQSVAEILAILKSEPTNASSKSPSKHAIVEDANSRPVAKNTLLGSIVVGIAALVGVGLWFAENPKEMPVTKPITADQPSLENNPSKAAIAPETKIDQHLGQLTEKSDSDSESAKKLDDQVKQPTEQSALVAISEPKDNGVAQSVSDNNRQLMVSDQLLSQSGQQELPGPSTHVNLINKHLAAAEKALKAGRLTTPAKDNAHKYYQMVLALEPNNVEARTGLQKIVNQYVQFIDRAKTKGKQDVVKRYLQRAQAILPEDLNLQRIQAELTGAQ